MGYFKLLVFIILVFWIAFYLKVRLEWLFRNNQQEIDFANNWYNQKKSHSSFLLRLMGVVWYSPYLWPTKAILIWIIVLISILVNW